MKQSGTNGPSGPYDPELAEPTPSTLVCLFYEKGSRGPSMSLQGSTAKSYDWTLRVLSLGDFFREPMLPESSRSKNEGCRH